MIYIFIYQLVLTLQTKIIVILHYKVLFKLCQTKEQVAQFSVINLKLKTVINGLFKNAVGEKVKKLFCEMLFRLYV